MSDAKPAPIPNLPAAVFGLIALLFGLFAVIMGKFGNDVKPIVERMKDLLQIAWRTQARAEELPSNSSLPNLAENEDKQ